VKPAIKGLTVIFIISIAFSLFSLTSKIATEQKSRVVEISVPVSEIEQLARITGRAPGEILGELKSAGVTSLAVEETTVKDMINRGRILVIKGWQLMDHQRFLGVENDLARQIIIRKNFNPESYYIFTRDKAIFDKLKIAMFSRGYEIITEEGEGTYLIQEVKGRGGFNEIGLGLDRSIVEAATSSGFNVVLMLKGVKGKTAQEIEQISEIFDEDISVLILQNNEIPQRTEAADILFSTIKEKGIRLGLDEFKETESLKKGIGKKGYDIVRVYNRPPHKWMEEYLLAVRDRNDRLLYLHLFLSGDEDLVRYNKEHIKSIYDDVISAGFKPGFYPEKASSFSKNQTSSLAMALLPIVASMGLAPGLFYLLRIFKMKESYALLYSYGFLSLMWMLALMDFSFFRIAASLTASVLYPCLAVCREMPINGSTTKNLRRGIASGLLTLARATALTSAGALLITGICSDMDFIVGLEKFRGIKAMYIAAFVLIGFIYIWFQYGRVSLNKPLFTVGNLFALALAGGILYILINRTGNFSVVPIPKWELYFRIWLEEVLPVRPRTKEFLIGFPALVLAGGLKNPQRPWQFRLLLVGGLLGELSMINTFSHFHANALISIVRSLEGILLGSFIGTLALIGFFTLCRKGNERE
jgi:hypothetical protein